MELLYFDDHAPSGYAHRGGIATSSAYKHTIYNGAISRYLALCTAFSMKTH